MNLKQLIKSNPEIRQNIFFNQREYIDIVKGTAIFLMLWGHCIQFCTNGEFNFFDNWVFRFIYSFHMPLFTLVSGYLFSFSCRKRNLSNLLIHRTQSLLQPIFMCTIFNYILVNAINIKNILNIFDGKWLLSLDSLWFLWSILSASLIIGIAYKSSKNNRLRFIIALSGLAFVCLFPNMESNVFQYPYFVIGFIFAFLKQKLPKQVINIKYLSIVFFPIMFCLYYVYIDKIYSFNDDILSKIGANLFRWILGLVGSIFMLVLLQCFHRLTMMFKLTILIGYAISAIGKKSLQIYCISVSTLSVFLPRAYDIFCKIIGCNLFAQNMLVYDFVFTFVVAIAYAVVLYFIIKLLEKIKVNKILFGR